MFDGRFDQHFAEFFASSRADKEPKARQERADALRFAAALALLAVVCMAVIR